MSSSIPFPESKLFTPLQIGNITLQHRIVMAPLTRLRATADHVILSMAKEYYGQRATTPGTLLIAESNLISPRHGGAAHMPGIWNQEQIAAWKEVVNAVHAKGSYIFLQLVALGRVADEEQLKKEGGYPVVGASAIPFRGTGMGEGVVVEGATPHPLTQDEIQTTVDDFVQAAKNGIEAGFDGIEIHGANGYLVDQFLQDTSNQRTDSYGGSIENRARFALEVATAVSQAIGKERLGFRISPFSTFQGMKMDGNKPVEQFSYLTQKLKDLDLAYLHIIESRVVNNVDCEKTEGIEPFLEIWGREKPVLVAGGFNSERAKEAVEVEYKDFNVGVVFGRWFISNPDLVFRIKHGLELNGYERDTFYAVEQKKGYLDYPSSEEWKRGCGKCMNGSK
ncbi:Chanoclavine-I aldehyde reductase fgaOx3 [Pseudocercospora fuligena]|uniref:Chanoclavine-I aldehyde reductase fgaOx3 n=1 Tax=Pseudocercospora fuligena TaxID=685502 RepID=A0A8H6VKG8_9PEZI|nr:Chanoclavine-I aldehyde reductase fgaOx3 [Pseudocercospora fuligena]